MRDIPKALEQFLESLESADWDGFERHLADDVVYDASVPGWRYRHVGAEAVMNELRTEWTGKHPWRITEMRCMQSPDGAVVELEVRGRCPGDDDHDAHEEACRMANIFRFEQGRIAEHRLYCCGEWDEETVRRVDEDLAERSKQ